MALKGPSENTEILLEAISPCKDEKIFMHLFAKLKLYLKNNLNDDADCMKIDGCLCMFVCKML